MNFSSSSLMVSLLLGTLGMGLFMYGKKQQRYPQLLGGLALMVYPYFTSGTGWTLGWGVVILAGITAAVNAGY